PVLQFALEMPAEAVRSLGEAAQLHALARAFREPLLAARVVAGDEAGDALVLHRRIDAELDVMQALALGGGAETPVEPRVQRKVAPERDPLPLFLDAVRGDVTVVASLRL